VVLANKNNRRLTNTTPSAPTRWLREIFLDVAATPPRLRRGVAWLDSVARLSSAKRGTLIPINWWIW
jgi:hypothetical protein